MSKTKKKEEEDYKFMIWVLFRNHKNYGLLWYKRFKVQNQVLLLKLCMYYTHTQEMKFVYYTLRLLICIQRYRE